MSLHLRSRQRGERMFVKGGDLFDIIEAQKGERPVYKCINFKIEELVTPELFEEYRDNQDRLWQLLDVRALMTLDALRLRYGPTTVNDWLWGGSYVLSGLRPWDTTTGAPLSQHKFGRGFDPKFKDISAHDVRKDLYAADRDGRQFGTPCFQHITCIEDFAGMSWFHFDCRNHDVSTLGLMVVGK